MSGAAGVLAPRFRAATGDPRRLAAADVMESARVVEERPDVGRAVEKSSPSSEAEFEFEFEFELALRVLRRGGRPGLRRDVSGGLQRDIARHSKTRWDKARQGETRQDKARHSKTR